MASKKGRNKGGGKPGNKNGAKGPRVGRKDKTIEPLPQPQPEALAGLPKRRRHEKTPGSGRDFQKGQNSHTGTVFQRGPDQIPRGNGTLMMRVAFHDEREMWLERLKKIIRFGSDNNFRVLNQQYLDRTEGKPGRAGEAPPASASKFVILTREGQEVELLPPTPQSPPGKAPAVGAAVSADDALILRYTAPVRPV